MSLEKQTSELVSTGYIEHSPAEGKAAEPQLWLPFLSVRGSDIAGLLITPVESFLDPWP